MRIAVVVNPTKIDPARLKKTVGSHAQAAGWERPLYYQTSTTDAGQKAANAAIKEGVDIVAVVGGDGTLRAVVEVLTSTSIVLGIIPSGTGNILARNLGLSLVQEQAIKTLFHGQDRQIDVGMIEIFRENQTQKNHVFLVMAGLGIDAKMIAKTRSELKKAVGWLAYVDAGMRSLPELKPMKIRYRLDGSSWHTTNAHTIIAGNCGLLPGGILLIPEAKLDDGILDFMMLRPRGPFGWLKVWNVIAWENGVLRKSAAGRKIIDLSKDVKDVTYRRGHEVSLTLDSPQQIQLDGDDFGRATGVRCWVDPAALTVRVPR